MVAVRCDWNACNCALSADCNVNPRMTFTT